MDSDWGTYQQSWVERVGKEGCPKRVPRISCGDCRKQEVRQVGTLDALWRIMEKNS